MAIGQSKIVYVKGTQSHETNLNKFIFVDYDNHIDYYQFKFECLDAKTGNVLWTKPCNFDFNAEYNNWGAPETIKIDKDNFFVNYTGIIYSFSLHDGSAKYSFKRDEHALLHMRENYTYAYEDEEIIIRDHETGEESYLSLGSSMQSLVLDSSGFVYLMTVDFKNIGQLRCFKKHSDGYLGCIWLREFTGYLHNAFFDAKQKRIAIVTGYDYSKPDKILCFDSEKGEQLWNFPISGFSIDPLITGNYVFTFLGTNVSCLNKKNGEQVWSFNISNPIDKPALSNNESIFLNNDAFTILCLDQATGKQKWSYNSKKGVSAVQFLDSGSLLVKEGMNFLNLNPTTGELIYQFAQLAVSNSIFIDGKTICNYDAGNVMFINTETKTISQSMLLPPVKRILEDFANLDVNVWGYWQRKLLVSVLDYDKNRQVNLICYNAETFKELWSIPIKEPSYKESIQILDGKILLLNENFLSLRSMDNGEILWQITLNTHNPEHLSVNPDYVYIKDQGEAICFSTETGCGNMKTKKLQPERAHIRMKWFCARLVQ